MVDYWVSFATSLDPNDSHGNTSREHALNIQLLTDFDEVTAALGPIWDAYTLANQVCSFSQLLHTRTLTRRCLLGAASIELERYKDDT
jgi:peroxiredoxin